MVIALCMRIADYSTINNLQPSIGRSNWLVLISKAEHEHLDVFKVHDDRDKASRKTAIIVAVMLDAKKRA